jgi:hypothetical protein
MRLKQESRVLQQKALASLIFTIEAFNSPHEGGRATRVLLHLQHSFEMLLKAALVQTGDKRVHDPETGRSIGFERCLRLAAENDIIKLADADAGTLRAIDAMRDDEQHWFNIVSEQLLYLHARAGITLFDELLQRVFANTWPTTCQGESCHSRWIHRVNSQSCWMRNTHRSPRSCNPGAERDTKPERGCARCSLWRRTSSRTRVSDKDVTRVERGIRDGDTREQVFPRLEEIATAIDGEGVNTIVHFTKQQGAPVRYVADESVPAAGIREVDLLKKYHRPPAGLARELDISPSRSTALRRHLGIDSDGPYSHQFVLSPSNKPRRYSDNALRLMRETLNAADLDAIWKAHSPNRGARSWDKCDLPCCRAPDSRIAALTV